MNTYFCTLGQSFSDVCLSTYKTLDDYVKLLNDNLLTPNSVPYSAQSITWDSNYQSAVITVTQTVVITAPVEVAPIIIKAPVVYTVTENPTYSYSCQLGQSFSDVALNTYKSLDKYVKMLNDNGISPNSVPYTAQQILWGDAATNIAAVVSIPAIAPEVYSTGLPQQVQSVQEGKVDIEFTAIASVTSYTAATIQELALLVGKNIYFAMIDDTRLFGNKMSWDNTTFSINYIPIGGGESIILFAK